MNVYVWQRVAVCSDNYHTNGGVVVFAATENEARVLANAVEGCQIDPTEKPDDVRECAPGESKVYIMPDAGCC